MSRTRNLLVLPLLFVLLGTAPIVDNVSNQEARERIWQLVRTVKDILAGEDVEQARTAVSQGARLVYGARFEELEAVVAGEIKGLSLADTSYHGVMIRAETNSSEDAGFLILKTQKSDTTNVRFHTVVFMKDSTGQFKIHGWHTGGSDR